jgi:hypothetical protein
LIRIRRVWASRAPRTFGAETHSRVSLQARVALFAPAPPRKRVGASAAIALAKKILLAGFFFLHVYKMLLFVSNKIKIKIKNFGPIDHLIFDINKDLHLIYGQNNVGKSYATYCLYCLLKNINVAFDFIPIPSFEKNIFKFLDKFSTEILTQHE